jgi:hypothetical protein
MSLWNCENDRNNQRGLKMTGNKIIVCPECAGDIDIGIAINPEFDYDGRAPCFYSPTILNHKTVSIIEVFKCKNCGHSYTDN